MRALPHITQFSALWSDPRLLLEELEDAAKSGRAQQLQNIAPQLEAIAADEKVMVRARNRARQLLGKDAKAS